MRFLPHKVVVATFCSWLVIGCRTDGALTPAGAGAAPPRNLGVVEIAALIPAGVREARAWGEAIFNALGALELNTDKESACAVIAVIGQESGFAADPVVPGLAGLLAARVDRYKARLGPAGEPLFNRLLSGRAPDDARPFQQRMAAVRTERDVDLLFRDLLSHYEVNHPALFAAVSLAGKLADVNTLAELNPITTAGSMQVSVRFAAEWARARKGSAATPDSVREALYTRAGGVYYGTARLLAYPTRYDAPIFRFADYNAGFYSSRNAALQSQLTRLTGRPLALDGDLLAYDKDGTPREDETASLSALRLFAQRLAPELPPGQLRRDLLSEKTLAFEDTATYRSVKAAVVARTPAIAADYAILPQVAITSPKFTRTRSTAWFAQSVDRRYRACLGAAAR